jgi:signal transduction histidine kinase/CheY-like chemotaxis protein
MAVAGAPSGTDDASYFEHAPCALLVANTAGTILRANATFCKWLGYREDELLGSKRAQDLLSIGGRLFFQTHCSPLLAIQGSVAEIQLELLTSTRERLPVLINIVRRHHGADAVDEWAFMLTNDRRAYERELLKERQRAEASLAARLGAEAQLQEVNAQMSLAHQRKDEFLATLAHELRNPLAPLRNVLEVLRLKQEQGSAPVWGLDIIERQTRQLTHLVDDLMDVARITQGRLQLRCQPCDLVAIVRAAVADTGAIVSAAHHRLQLRLPPSPVQVYADDTRLTQVIVNLLTNAAKYTPDGGDITIGIATHAGEVSLAIADTGIGIPAHALSSVFSMFSQLAPALERAQGGLGIGLSLVRGLVELHGGQIRADSEGIGCGSVFTVTLPLHAQLPEQAASHAPPDEEAGTRILVVDDNIDAADTLCMALDLLGHTVRTAYSGQEALEVAAQFLPAVILLDIGLPDMNGYAVAQHIRDTPWGAGMRLIAATGWGQDHDRQRAREAGFNEHLVKPIAFDSLRRLLNGETGK